GKYETALPKPIEVKVTESDRMKARLVKTTLKGQIYGAVGPRSMQMWNKISEADFLRVFGIAREGFDGLRLAKMAERVPNTRAEAAVDYLIAKGMDLRLGDNPARSLTRDMAA